MTDVQEVIRPKRFLPPGAELFFMTHRGTMRPGNQDALQIAERTFTGETDVPLRTEATLPLFVSVVDGLGGHQGGQRAAELLVETLSCAAGAFAPETDPGADIILLRSILEKAETRMKREALLDEAFRGMGATVAGLVIRSESVLAFNCGDCRAYRFSGCVPEKLTRDHSLVQELVDSRVIAEEEMRFHPRKNVVTSAVTGAPSEAFELYAKAFPRISGDVFFICSDGVWEALSGDELARLAGDPSPEAPQKLRDALFEARCSDNVSFILVRFRL